jgi:hypothetical protein
MISRMLILESHAALSTSVSSLHPPPHFDYPALYLSVTRQVSPAALISLLLEIV